MKSRTEQKLFASAMLTAVYLWAAVVVVQAQQPRGPLDAVPVERRQRLAERLDAFVGHARAKRWDLVYSMLGEQYKAAVEGGLSRDRFLASKHQTRITRFTPAQSIPFSENVDDGWVMIIGCGEYDERGPNPKLESSVEAYWQDGDWYFSEIGPQLPCIHCDARRCRH